MENNYNRKDILNIRRRVESVRFLVDTKATARLIDGKQFIVRPVFLGGQDAKTAVLKLAEYKTMQDMGFDVPLLDFDKCGSS